MNTTEAINKVKEICHKFHTDMVRLQKNPQLRQIYSDVITRLEERIHREFSSKEEKVKEVMSLWGQLDELSLKMDKVTDEIVKK